MSRGEGLLRDPVEADLNALLARTRRTADLLEQLAGEAEPGLGTLFRELAAAHRARADELETEVRQLGALPMDVDPDAETLEQALARLRAAVAGVTGHADRARALDRLRAEEELGRLLDDAASHELPARARAALDRLRETVEAARTKLAEHAAKEEARGG
ncbi:MAG: DUF2383 domain-containing protein [Myxococcota bacterium]|nr:DUF2383 domain-containing protein [Myxococcota bacterium]